MMETPERRQPGCRRLAVDCGQVIEQISECRLAEGLVKRTFVGIMRASGSERLFGICTNVNQPFVLEIDRSGVAAELKQLFDVVLYLEYIASF